MISKKLRGMIEMGNTVNLIKIENILSKHVYYVLTQPKWIQDWDEVHDPVEYILPEGYQLLDASNCMAALDDQAIFDPKGMLCDIAYSKSKDLPVLVSACGTPILE